MRIRGPKAAKAAKAILTILQSAARLVRQRIWDVVRLNYFLYPGIRRWRGPEFLSEWYEWRRARLGPFALIANALVFGYFWLLIPIRARRVARNWDKDAAWRRWAIAVGRRWMTDPEDLATFRIEDEAELRQYQRRMEQIPVIRTIESGVTDHSRSLIDKTSFQARCENAGLPVPFLYAVIRDGRFLDRRPLGPAARVLTKPARGSGGGGVAIHRLADAAAYNALAGSLKSGEWLVQEVIEPHPDLVPLALDALPTLRMTSLLDERGQPELVNSALRFAARPGVPVDNGHCGGLVAPVDSETGILGEGVSGWRPGTYPVHPVTKAAITGRKVPEWEVARDLVLDAHRRLYPDHIIIGWDLAVSDRGPVLIEANQRPAVRLTQRTAGRGIGTMRYGDLIAWHLRRAMAAGHARKRRFLLRG